MSRVASPLVALAVGAAGSGAANVAWTWQHGPVRVVAGIFATLLVPVAIHLWPRVPITGRATRVVRAAVMAYICLAAAAVNLAHAVMLLVGAPNPAGEHPLLAVLLITAVEALMVMASLARRAPAPAARTQTKRRPARKRRPAPPAAGPARSDELGETRREISAIMTAEGCSERTAFRRLAARRKQQAVS